MHEKKTYLERLGSFYTETNTKKTYQRLETRRLMCFGLVPITFGRRRVAGCAVVDVLVKNYLEN